MRILKRHLDNMGFSSQTCGDSVFLSENPDHISIGSGGSAKKMFLDSLNVKNWLKIFNALNKSDLTVFILSSHPLNIVTVVLARLFSGCHVVSHIHDPLPHSGVWYGQIIYWTQILQSHLSHKIVVFGDFLRKCIVEKYKVDINKTYAITHGVYREERHILENNKERVYISLLGRIDHYKGINQFLNAALRLADIIPKNFRFVLGGSGNLKPYEDVIERLGDRLLVKNYILSDFEFDEILQQSRVSVLPYLDGTQTGNVQVAYYNGCPVIVTKVGGIPELVSEGQTGFIIPPSDTRSLVDAISKILSSNSERFSDAVFCYYKTHLKWEHIIKDLIVILSKKNVD